MINLVLFGKSDILEKMAWARKYAGLKEEEERLKKASFKIQLAHHIITDISDPTLDSHKLGPKIKPLELNLPDFEQLDLFQNRIIKDCSLYGLFSQFENIPGKPEYEFGLGFVIETFNVFLEEKVHKMVDHVEIKKKMGFLKEKVVTKEKQLMTASDLFGEDFKGEETRLAVAGREKDSKDHMRYGLRLLFNVAMAGQAGYAVEKLHFKWKDAPDFLIQIQKQSQKMESAINKMFKVVGYEEPPTFSLLLGDITTSRKIASFNKEALGDGVVVDAVYE